MDEKKENSLSVDNPDTRISIDREHEIITIPIGRENKNFGDPLVYNKYKTIKKSKRRSSTNILSTDSTDDPKYHIATCQNGKFVATFDTGKFIISLQNKQFSMLILSFELVNLRIKILKNIPCSNYHNKFEVIVNFEIKDDLTVRDNPEQETKISNNNEDKENRWSFDISNVCRKNDNRYFILVAVSKINDEDMKKTIEERKDRKEASTAIYRVELVKKGNYDFDANKISIDYYTIKISGICKFIHKEVPSSESKKETISPESNTEYFSLRRFIILNFDGINSFHCEDNFNLYKVFDYPHCTKIELNALSITSKTSDCINLLLSCIYDKYFLVEHYEDSVQVLEGNN